MQKISRFEILRKTWPRITDLRSTRMKCVMVDARWRRQGKRFYYKTVDEAKVRAEQLAIERKNKGMEALEFPTELRMAAIEAQAKLRSWQKTLTHAVDHYVSFLEGEQKKHASLFVTDCVDQYLAARKLDFERGELSRLSLYEITARAHQLRGAFNGDHIRELTPARMRTFLESYRVGARTRTNIRLRLSRLFNWLCEQGYIETNPVERIRYRVPESDVQILSVDRVELLLAKAQESEFRTTVLPYLICLAFQGLRPGEAEQLRFNQLDFDANAIHVMGPTSKSRRTRWVEMNQTFIRWITPYRQASGPIVGPNLRKELESVRRSAGFDPKSNPWSPDCLRRSFATYWLPIHQDTAKLAHLMGNSEAVVLAHYRRVVAKLEAKRFWSLCPR